MEICFPSTSAPFTSPGSDGDEAGPACLVSAVAASLPRDVGCHRRWIAQKWPSQSIELKSTAVRWRRISDDETHTTPDDAEASIKKIKDGVRMGGASRREFR